VLPHRWHTSALIAFCARFRAVHFPGLSVTIPLAIQMREQYFLRFRSLSVITLPHVAHFGVFFLRHHAAWQARPQKRFRLQCFDRINIEQTSQRFSCCVNPFINTLPV
jgi:hypothetical protein